MVDVGQRDNPIAVVGANCPLGRHLIDALVRAGRPVRAVARTAADLPRRWLPAEGIERVSADLRDDRAVAEALSGARTIVWLAHIRPGDGTSEREQNAGAIAAACRVPGVRRVIMASSGGAVYGNPDYVPVREDHPVRPLSDYGKAKCAMEHVLVRHAGSNLTSVILRPGNIYGKEYLADGAPGVIGAFTRSLARHEPVVMRAGGAAARDFVHADDVASAIRLALEVSEPLAIWNVGTGVATKISDVLDSVCAILDAGTGTVVHTRAEPSDVDRISLSVDRIHGACGWTPRFDLSQGLRETLAGASELGTGTRSERRR